MGKYLDQCLNNAWEITRGRKRVQGNKIVDVINENLNIEEIKYGWLEPNGTFHLVEFGYHQTWASKHLLNLFRNGEISYEEASLSNGQDPGDILINKGWILIHNPSRHQIKITRNQSKELTKAQKEYLFDFLREHGKIKEANELYKE